MSSESDLPSAVSLHCCPCIFVILTLFTAKQVPVPPVVENGFSFRMRNLTVTWRSKDFAAQLPECVRMHALPLQV